MKDIILFIIVSLIGYLFGSINSAVLISRIFYKKDIRTLGSKNAGTTNVLRNFGKKAAAFTFLGDFLKGIIAVLIGLLIKGEIGMVLAGAFAVIGHNWPLYFSFKGGKGVLTSFSVLLFVSPYAALIGLVFFILVVAISRYVSLGSILSSILVVALTYFFKSIGPVFYLTIFISLLVIIRHNSNIYRLLKGRESKLGEKSNN